MEGWQSSLATGPCSSFVPCARATWLGRVLHPSMLNPFSTLSPPPFLPLFSRRLRRPGRRPPYLATFSHTYAMQSSSAAGMTKRRTEGSTGVHGGTVDRGQAKTETTVNEPSGGNLLIIHCSSAASTFFFSWSGWNIWDCKGGKGPAWGVLLLRLVAGAAK